MKVKRESEVAQSCPTPSDPMDWSLPGSSVYEIFQARVLEWGAIAFSEIISSLLLLHLCCHDYPCIHIFTYLVFHIFECIHIINSWQWSCWSKECKHFKFDQFSSVQSLSLVPLFSTPWITAPQASLSITNSWSSLKLISLDKFPILFTLWIYET